MMTLERTPDTTEPPKPAPELELVSLAKLTRNTVQRLAPFCQIRLPNDVSQVPLVHKTNGKILQLIQAVDTSMLVAQIGYRLSSDAASSFSGLSLSEMLQTMAAHGHGHCLKTLETFRDVQQRLYKIAAATQDNETLVLVPPDPQQSAHRRIKLKEVGTNLVANLSLLERFARSVQDLTSWWEWLEEELMSPNSTLLPKMDTELFAKWGRIKAGYLDYYNTILVVYARYPQLFTASSTAWQSLGSVPPVPSSPGSLWESYEDLGIELGEQGVVDDIARTSSSSCDLSRPSAEKLKEGKMGVMTTTTTTTTANRQHVKGVAEKLTFVKAFGVKEKKKKTMTGKGKETQREVNNGITQDHNLE